MPTIGVAIALPEPHASELAQWRASTGDPLAQQVPTHITLLPPVEVSQEHLPQVVTHLQQVQADPFRIELHGTGSFRPISPVVFIALSEGIGGCELLQQQIHAGPLDIPLAFPFHPHVTVGQAVPETELDRVFHELAAYEAGFEVSCFTLYLQDDTGSWQILHEFSLAG